MVSSPVACLFQSTLPLRGATRHLIIHGGMYAISIHAPLAGSDLGNHAGPKPLQISIHAPLAGSDAANLLGDRTLFLFQSTLPLRGATGCMMGCMMDHEFQSTLPLRGATRRGRSQVKGEVISIHAPLAGSDPTSASRCSR